MRVALLGAFPFPLPQGSQVYFAEQARALRDAGADVTLVVYGNGEVAPQHPLAGVAVVRAPRALAPRRLVSGPSPGKPLADAALAATLVAAHRRRAFDVVLAHNAEAAAVALALRPLMQRPVVYVAHTLLAHELARYAPQGWRCALDAAGARIDAALARRADGVLALSRAAERALGAHASGPLARIPPGLAAAAPPDPEQVAAACRRRGLVPGRFALYAGNLDGYQELPELAELAARVDAPVVVATHAAGAAPAPLVTLRVDDAAEARLLLFGAAAALLPRRAPGGFPVKLLNYLEAGRATLAHEAVADGLAHRESAWLLPDGASREAAAAALETLLADALLAARLGAAARRHLRERHDPAALARRTLALIERASDRPRVDR